MSEHTPTPWIVNEAPHMAPYDDAKRTVACVNAFHSPDGRKIATEDIGEGLVWKLIDALERTAARCAAHTLIAADQGKADDYAMMAHTETAGEDAYALLSSLKIREPENG